MTQDTPRTLDDMIPVLTRSRVVPVVVLPDAASAVPIARALLAGGIEAIEITLRNDAAYDGIRAVKAEVPEIILGVGTVIHENHVEFCADLGVDFIVTPGTTDRLYDAIAEAGLTVIPGVATPSEAVRALEAGCTTQKFFPADINGGVKAVKAIGGPLRDIMFMPTGGISAQTAPEYLALPNVMCVGGSWVTKSGDPATITKLAKEASSLD